MFVNHSDGFPLQYNNRLNTAYNNSRISLIREQFFAMQKNTVDDCLQAVACPHNCVRSMMLSILIRSLEVVVKNYEIVGESLVILTITLFASPSRMR